MWRSVISNSPPPWSRSMRRSAASQRGRSASGTEDHSASARSWAWCSVDQVHAPLSLRVILPTRPTLHHAQDLALAEWSSVPDADLPRWLAALRRMDLDQGGGELEMTLRHMRRQTPSPTA